MMIRRTLNGLTARTLRDTGRDPWDYVECAHRSHWLLRWWRPLANLLGAVFTLALFGLIGAMLATGV